MTRIISEPDLMFSLFSCCGDEDLYPFRCPECGRCMVFCYECDTLYADLANLTIRGSEAINHSDPNSPIFSCRCGFQFEYRFMDNPEYRSTEKQWLEFGAGAVLR